MRSLVQGEPLVARRLAAVSIPYTRSESTIDWLGIFTAGADLLPQAADELLKSHVAAASAPDAAAAAGAAAARGAAARALGAAADCVAAAAALAGCQPARVAAALARTRLLTAVGPSGAPLASDDASAGDAVAPARVPVESLAASIAAGDDGTSAGGALDARLPELQALLRRLEAPTGEYPVTAALLELAAGLLRHHSAAAPVPALVAFAIRDVLGSLSELPFKSPAGRWRLAALALRVARLSVGSGATGGGGAAPKAPGPPSGVLITRLAAAVVQQMAFAGHGYLSATLPPPCAALMSAAEQRGGGGADEDDGAALAAALDSVLELLQLARVLLGCMAHFPFEVPLQQFWLSVSGTRLELVLGGSLLGWWSRTQGAAVCCQADHLLMKSHKQQRLPHLALHNRRSPPPAAPAPPRCWPALPPTPTTPPSARPPLPFYNPSPSPSPPPRPAPPGARPAASRGCWAAARG
jgi:hypothetical protein